MTSRTSGLVGASVLALCLALPNVSLGAASGPESFASPSAAKDGLIAAVRNHDQAALRTILGPSADDLLFSGDSVEDAHAAQMFLAAIDERSSLEPIDRMRVALRAGKDNWEFPIPIVRRSSGWQFDAAAGKNEILARRIGRNELQAVQACLAFVDAQREYAAIDRGDGVLEYAQRFLSTDGRHDGLYWPTKAGETESPLGPAFAEARAEGYTSRPDASGRTPFHGYYFKILAAQGPDAKGGAYEYLAGNRMIGGFALVAWPASYGASGFTTFMVNQDGVVFQNDLGSGTARIAPGMTKFDPGKGWTKV